MEVKVEVFLKGSLNRYFGGSNKGEMHLPEGAVVGDILQQLSLPREKTSLISVNGVKVSLAAPLREGDRVVIFPPVSGG